MKILHNLKTSFNKKNIKKMSKYFVCDQRKKNQCDKIM